LSPRVRLRQPPRGVTAGTFSFRPSPKERKRDRSSKCYTLEPARAAKRAKRANPQAAWGRFGAKTRLACKTLFHNLVFLRQLFPVGHGATRAQGGAGPDTFVNSLRSVFGTFGGLQSKVYPARKTNVTNATIRVMRSLSGLTVPPLRPLRMPMFTKCLHCS
jgi:hypothetical protein